ncbi:MAG: 3-coathanger stack domain-containing protein [Chitinophagaceae bacterium]
MKKILFIVLLFFAAGIARTQVPDALQQRISGKTKLTDIMRDVELFYANDNDATVQKGNNEEEAFESDYLRWKRWEYYNSSRLDENGNIIPNVNRKIYDGWKAYENSHQAIINAAQSSYSSWNVLGPTTVTRYGAGYNSGYGRVSCIAFHPSLTNYLLIGTPQGGIWKSTNNGTSWLSLSDNLPSSAIGGLVWDRTNSNVIYALTGDGDASGGGFVSGYGFNVPSLGVFKSIDGGTTWLLTGNFPGVSGNFYGFKLMQHPSNANTLFAATTDGIYKTTNGGTTWTQEQVGNFTDIEFKPGDPTIMYAAQQGSTSPFWRSTNSGDTWSNAGIAGVPTNASRIAIGVSANNANYIYLLAGGATGSGSFVGVYRSTTSGTPVFTSRSTTPNILGYPSDGSDAKSQTGYDLAIEVDPANVNTVITGGINIWRSTDGGANWGGSSRTQWFDNPAGIDYVHADVHNLTYNALSGNVYSTSDGGVGYSTNDGANWTFIPSNLQILATYHADWYEADDNLIACGAQDNGTDLRYTASNTYRHIYGADGFDCVMKSNDPNTIVFVANAEIHKTTNGGTSETNTSPGGLGTFPQIARDFNTNTRIFAGDGNNIYRSTDFGGSWTTFSAGLGSRALTTCPSNSDRLYCSNGATLLRSDDATTTMTFTTVSGTTGYPTGVNLTDIDVSPSNSLNAFASFGGYVAGKKVYYTANGGASWTNLSGSLPNVACHSIAVDASGTAYVGTDIGVFVKASGMTDWQPFYNYLPRTPVSELMINNTSGRIFASTFGRGNFYTDLYSTCPVNLNIVGNYSGASFYEASSTVISSATVSQGTGNTMALKSGGYVRLDPGFEVKNSSEMSAYIAPCNTGGVPLTVQSMSATLPTKTMYVPAKNGVRFADGIIHQILPGKNGAEIEIVSDGIYSARIVDQNGAPVKNIFTDQQKETGTGTISFSTSGMGVGLYYLQLFKGHELVHFQEMDIR